MNKRFEKPESGKGISIEDKLPVTITEITVQKKNRDRFSLFHDGIFIIGVSSKTLTDYALQKGVEMTPSLFREIETSENLHAVKENALRFLARRDHASTELRQKLQKKGFDLPAIEIVVDELTERGYIDDEKFALTFAKEKAELNKWGAKKITAELFKKAMPKQIIDRAVKKAMENLQQEQICVDLALKKKRQFLREENPYKRKQKIYNYLAGRGFSNSDIKKSMPQITKSLDA